jgi:hypothetical protein
MNSGNLPRKPVHMIPENAELMQKSTSGQSPVATDYVHNVDAVSLQKIPQSYRAPVDRENGNAMFKRYLDGRLHFEYAVHKVIDAIHRAKVGNDMSPEDQAILVTLFPEVPQFGGAAPGMASSVALVNLRISPVEREAIRQAVGQHFAEEMNWNAGLGGGSVPGRKQTYRPS